MRGAALPLGRLLPPRAFGVGRCCRPPPSAVRARLSVVCPAFSGAPLPPSSVTQRHLTSNAQTRGLPCPRTPARWRAPPPCWRGSTCEPTGTRPCPMRGLPRPRTPAAAASQHQRTVFVGWRCSPLGLCSALPLLAQRGFPFGRCRACPRSTIVVRSYLSALPRVLLLLLRCSCARWAHGAVGSVGGCPPAALRGLRPRSRASRWSPASRCAANARCYARHSRPLGGCPSLRSGQRVQQVARWITFASFGAFSLKHYVTSPRSRPPRATFQSEPSPCDDSPFVGALPPTPPVC